MANNRSGGDKPSHNVSFLLPADPGDAKSKDRWIEIGQAWVTGENDAISFLLSVVPAPLLAGRPVRVVLNQRRDRGTR